MSSEPAKKSAALDQIKEFVVIFGGNFIVLILLLVVVNYFLAPFDIKSHLDAVSSEIQGLRGDVGMLAREIKAIKAQTAPAKATK
ncbi:MAG: hypothetical protein IT342_27200 [Candidatus Melainabacteria bacterium]|nr:hypothetical protein [Candidatus Melainabacteria bacterium]